MIIRVNILLEKPEIVKDYRPAFVSLLKSILSKNYPDVYQRMYCQGARQKSFTFSVGFSHPKFEENKIQLGNTSISFCISADEEADNLVFYNAFTKHKGQYFPLADQNQMKIERIEIRPTSRITDSAVLIKFLSPLVVRQHIKGEKDRYFVYGEESFVPCLNESLKYRTGSDTNVRLEAVEMKKTVVPAFGIKIRSTIGTFRLSGYPAILDYLQDGGIGSRRSEGFGMFEVIGRPHD